MSKDKSKKDKSKHDENIDLIIDNKDQIDQISGTNGDSVLSSLGVNTLPADIPQTKLRRSFWQIFKALIVLIVGPSLSVVFTWFTVSQWPQPAAYVVGALAFIAILASLSGVPDALGFLSNKRRRKFDL